MTKRTYQQFKKVYLELNILLEKSKDWENVNLQEIENNKIKLEEIWKKIKLFVEIP